MVPDNVMTATYIWMFVYAIGAISFFGIAFWGIYRGGKDVLEILRNEDSLNG